MRDYHSYPKPTTVFSLVLIAFLVLGVFATVFQLRTKTSTDTKAAPPIQTNPNKITWQGQAWDVTGVNMPWFNWSCDFGCNGNGGVVETKTQLAQRFQQLKDSGIHMVRWWVFPGDNPWQITSDANGPTAMNAAIYADFDAALELANQYDLYYNFVLFSAATAPPRIWVTDATQRAKLAQVLGTLFARYATSPRIMSWEVYNEPEFQIWNNQIDETSAVATAKAIADSVHANSNALVTVGTAFADGLPMWANANLDYYSPHWYDYMNGGDYCLRCNDYNYYKNKFNLTKPIVVGEMYAGADVDALQRFEDFRNKGYAGAWAWSLFYDRTADLLQVDLNAMRTYASSHTDVGPKTTGGGSSPTPTMASCTTKTFTTTLNGTQEVPSNTSTATGTASIVLNTSETQGTVTLSFSGLSSTQTAAHIHGPSPVGQNANPLFTLPNGQVANNTITVTSQQIQDLKAGLWYVNVHSQNFSGGEIRGQFACGTLPTPTTTSTPTPTSQPTSTPTPTVQAGSASLSLIPATASVQSGGNLAVQVRVNSGTTNINAVQANISFPAAAFTVASIDTSTSAFSIQAEQVIGTSTIRLARGTTTPVNGDKLIATINFTAKPLTVQTTAPVTFDTTSAVITSSGNTNILSTRNSATYTITLACKEADINCDGSVTILDLSALLTDYGTTATRSDLNHDGTVTILDLSFLLTRYGT